MAKRPDVSVTITAVDKTRQAFNSVSRGLSGVSKSLLNVKTAIGAALGAGGLGLMVKASLEATDALAKTARRIGVTTQELQKLHHAATITGVETATMNMALQRFIRRTAEAARGTGEAKDALRELGLNASQLTKLSLEEQMLALADAFEGAGTDADRVRLAMKLFDSEGVALVQTLKEGRSGLQGMFQEAETLGMVLSTSAVKGVEDTNDAIARLNGVIRGFRDQVIAKLAPGIEALAKHFTELIVEQAALKGGFEALAKAIAIDLIRALRAATIAGAQLFNFFIGSINALNTAWATFRNIFTFDEASAAATKVENLKGKLERLREELATPAEERGIFGFLGRSDEAIQEDIDAIQEGIAQYEAAAQKFEAPVQIPTIPVDGIMAAFDALESGLTSTRESITETAEEVVVAIGGTPTLFDQMREAASAAFQGISEGLQSTGQRFESLKKGFEDLGTRAMDSLTDGLAAAVEGTKSLKDAFGDMARGIIQDLTKMLIKYYLIQPLFNAITGAFPSPAGAASPAPGKAIGGSVQGGKAYMVGERGPEMFVPARTGSIVSNDDMNGGKVVVQQTINVTTGIQQTVRAEIANLMPQIQAAAKSAVAEARMRGGNYSRALVGA